MKRKDTEQILTAPAPSGFLEGSRADVSFAAGLLMDKFAWHLPLYRQQQRLSPPDQYAAPLPLTLERSVST